MTGSRVAVVRALEAAGWSADEHSYSLLYSHLRHPLGPTLARHIEAGDCELHIPEGGRPVTFPGTAPDAVVIAACLAASHSDPSTGLALALYEERQDHERTRLALTSAKRRARGHILTTEHKGQAPQPGQPCPDQPRPHPAATPAEQHAIRALHEHLGHATAHQTSVWARSLPGDHPA